MTDPSLEDERTDQQNEGQGVKQSRFGLMSTPRSLLKKMVPNIVFKRGKDAEVQTVTKDRLRFIAFDQGRLLVLKQLRDKVDGDKITRMRNFPGFQKKLGSGASSFKMPTVIWNAKVVRVYHLSQLQYIKWVNHQ